MLSWRKLLWKIVIVVGAGLFGLGMQFILALSNTAGRNLAGVLAGAALVWVVVDLIPLPTLVRSIARFVIIAVVVWFAATPLGISPELRIHPTGAVVVIGLVSIGTGLTGISASLRNNLIGATGLIAFAWVTGVLLGLPSGDRMMFAGTFVVASVLWIATNFIKLGPTLDKLVKVVIVAAVAWFAGSAAGFPRAFQLYFVGYTALTFPFFVLLDARWSTEPPRRGGLAILVIFIIASTLLTAMGFLLPQYSPAAEQEKIARLQKSYLERAQEQRQEEILQEVKAAGLLVMTRAELDKTVAEETQAALQEVQASLQKTTEEGAAATQEELAAIQEKLTNAQAEAADAQEEETALTEEESLIEQGKQVYNDYECYNCHKIGGEGGVKRRGPELDSVGLIMSPEAIRAEILDPTSSLSVGFEEEYDKVTMPDDFGERMSKSDIEAITAYLVSLQSTEIQSPPVLFPGPEDPDRGEGPFYEIPMEYQRVIPPEWWTDEAILEEGRAVYEGEVNSDAACAACHGSDGVPVMRGTPDFTDLDLIESLGEVFWYWRASTGVPDTIMDPWEEYLTPEQIMKAIVYQHSVSYGGPEEYYLSPPIAMR